MSEFVTEVRGGKRFAFGRNWRRFLTTMDDDRISHAEDGLRDLLGSAPMTGLRFLDVGSGSGLSSLAARRLGASVRSFDYDPDSVWCTEQLRARYFSNDPAWTVEHGSILDREFLSTLGTFDVVHAWGVLHHTGQLWQAMTNLVPLVSPHGRVFIALYNDQGKRSRRWLGIKRLYCSGTPGRLLVRAIWIPYFFVKTMLVSLWRRRNLFSAYRRKRGMSILHDWTDWLGGLPFEVASVEAVFGFFKDRGFDLEAVRTVNGSSGNNQFVFRRRTSQESLVARERESAVLMNSR